MKVTVVYAAPGVEVIEAIELGDGATVEDAVQRSGVAARLDLPSLSYAIFGQRAGPQTPLADGDRIELVRPLVADPKAVRRARAALHPLPPTRKAKRRAGT